MWRSPLRPVLGTARLRRRVFDAARLIAGVRSCCGISGKKWIRPGGFDSGVKTFNSLSKQKEPLILAREGVATWYGLRRYIMNTRCSLTFIAAQ